MCLTERKYKKVSEIGSTVLPKGFSLMELLVAMAVVGIVFSIALPAYQSQMLKANRAEAQSHLLGFAIHQAEYRLINNQYANSEELNLEDTDTYRYSVLQNTSTDFVIQAVAVGHQTGDAKCQKMSIDSTMRRLPRTCWY